MGAEEDDASSRPLLEDFESQFTERLGTSKKCCFCMRLSTGVQVIAVLIILGALNFFLTTFSRWGAPCYFWWKHWATTVTVVLGHTARIIAIPCCVAGLLGARKQEDNAGLRVLFYAILGLATFAALDLFLCLFEVHQVCNSAELREWNSCAHDWGKNQYACTATNSSNAAHVELCDALPLQENEGVPDGEDFAACTAVLGADGAPICGYDTLPESDWVAATCCSHHDGLWSRDKGPCARAPQERVAEFDVGNCELISDIYDVGMGIVWTIILLFLARVVNSHRVELDGDAAADGGKPKEME